MRRMPVCTKVWYCLKTCLKFHSMDFVAPGGQKPGSLCSHADAERTNMLLFSFDRISGDRRRCRKDAFSLCGTGTRKDRLPWLCIAIKKPIGCRVFFSWASSLLLSVSCKWIWLVCCECEVPELYRFSSPPLGYVIKSKKENRRKKKHFRKGGR